MNDFIPVIDLFAGPGGLGEGFSAYKTKKNRFPLRICLSVEKDFHAHQTLRLRSFFRKFSTGNAPREYYHFLKGQISQEGLFELFPEESAQAEREAWHAELGEVSSEEVDKRITAALNGSKTWVLIGGPPCQAYSTAGRSRMARVWRERPEVKEADSRHFLYKEYLRILASHTPPVFVMENVRGLLSAKLSNGPIFKQIMKDISNPTRVCGNAGSEEVSYRLYSFVKTPRNLDLFNALMFQPDDFVIKSEKYGIPQRRHRIIILGIRSDLNSAPKIIPEHDDEVSLRDVINDLPPLRSCFSRGKDSKERWRRHIKKTSQADWSGENRIGSSVLEKMKWQAKHLPEDLECGGEFVFRKNQPADLYQKAWFLDGRLRGYCNHVSKSHMPSDIQRYFFAACYGSVKKSTPMLRDFPKALWPAHRNVRAGIKKGDFNDRFRVQVESLPATTITSHISKDGHYYIHPDPSQARSLTVREAARIQTFPDNFFFCGPRTGQYVQVGNAVPPLLARQIADIVLDVLRQANLTD